MPLNQNRVNIKTMKNHLLALLLIISSTSFGQTKSKKLHLDKAKIAFIKYDEGWIFKNATKDKLNEKELFEVEELLKKCVAESKIAINLNKYYRQYIVVKNNIGEKEIWLNCFCRVPYLNWRTEIIQVSDGGDCYFNVKINLSLKTYYDLMVNGEA